jgi:hypothetical protein
MGPLPFNPLDPGARCDECGATGTVAVTVVNTTPEQVRRYCEACWPAARERWEAEQQEESVAWFRKGMQAGPYDHPAKPPTRIAESRSWHDVGLFIERHLFRPDGSPGVTTAELADVARDIVRDVPKMNGPMPEKIAAFAAKYARAAN